nr:hypothetical protein Q903MT_gene6149 [Picea sitchensis]
MTMIAPQNTKGVHTKPIHLLDPSIYCDYSPITNWGLEDRSTHELIEREKAQSNGQP